MVRMLKILKLLISIFHKVKMEKAEEYLYELYHKKVDSFFDKKYKVFFSSYTDSPLIKKEKNFNKIDHNIIWICWLQGEVNSPLIIKQCIASVRHFNPNRKIIVIDNSNYMEYVKIPEFIIDKKEKGLLIDAHFSDILRIELLKDYGGLWLDATIMVCKPISDSFFLSPFSTLKYKNNLKSSISNGKWTIYCMGGYNSLELFHYLSDFMHLFLSENTGFIDYFMTDYLIRKYYLLNVPFREYVDVMKENGEFRFLVLENINKEWCKISSIIKEDSTKIYKLTYKEQFNNQTIDGKPTVYKGIMNLISE